MNNSVHFVVQLFYKLLILFCLFDLECGCVIVISFNIMDTIQDEALLNFSGSDEVASETEDHVSGQSSSS